LREFIKKIVFKFLRFTRIDVNYFYNENFATTELRDKRWVKDFCGLVLEIFHPKSLIDFGCGTGDILKPFEEKGIEVRGIDASLANKRHAKIKPENFQTYDLRNRYKALKRYDLCFCFEMVEHLQEKYSDILIGNLTGASQVVLFTAAIDPEGVDHVNLKPSSWWIEKFKKFGFEFDRQLTLLMKERMKTISGIHSWYIENLLIFKKAI